MNVLILMAGEGKRFVDVGITTPKPIIEVNGKSILEWTTRSLPFIRHYEEELDEYLYPESLYFAIRKEHAEAGIGDQLKKIYGENINIIEFERTTGGNMETAYICSTVMDSSQPLLVLDSDNKYDDNQLMTTLVEASDFEESMVVCYFDPIDDSSKWAFVVSDGALVTEIVEKDATALSRGGCPMVGTFWFSTTELFLKYSQYLIANGWKTGPQGREEFYMTQVPTFHARNGRAVFSHKVSNVIPLGTPEDVERFKNEKTGF